MSLYSKLSRAAVSAAQRRAGAGLVACWIAVSTGHAAYQAGLAKVDITPTEPIRLSGYAVRRAPSEGVEQRLWAKALALRGEEGVPAVLLTVDNCGVPGWVTEKVWTNVHARHAVPRERFTVSSSHTHTGPCLSGILPNLFVAPIPAEEQGVIDRYTEGLVDRLTDAAAAALSDLRPARVVWGQGKAGFAKNRRTAEGPVDHSLPVLQVWDRSGRLRGLVANYACHCTTLVGDFNRISGDWSGFAQARLEEKFPGAIALVTIGCGADANPHPRGTVDLAREHGAELAEAAAKVMEGNVVELDGPLVCGLKRLTLPFEVLPTRAQWEERAQQPGIVGYHAQRNLERLKRGEAIPTELPYAVQTWVFGEKLALVFLPGEVVVDYALRIKKAFDAERVWVTAYANDVPCYIPSKRILQEGGYEAEHSLWYYDRPARLKPECEELIFQAVEGLIPEGFRTDSKRAQGTSPRIGFYERDPSLSRSPRGDGALFSP